MGPEDLPAGFAWPQPKNHLFPFSGGLKDYLRAVGPGVYVGVGWKDPKKNRGLGSRFLHFLMVKKVD